MVLRTASIIRGLQVFPSIHFFHSHTHTQRRPKFPIFFQYVIHFSSDRSLKTFFSIAFKVRRLNTYRLMTILVTMIESHISPTSLRKRRKWAHRRVKFTQKIKLQLVIPEQPERSVYIVSRPVTKARYLHLSSLSERKFSLSHWAL